jgi:hypothetical protein
MSDVETKLRDCLQRTAQAIRDYTTRPIPPAWRAVLQDIVETLHDVTKAILDNEPYPAGGDQPLPVGLTDAETLRTPGPAVSAVPTGRLTEQQKQAYLKAPTRCPYCGSQDLEGQTPGSDCGGNYRQRLTCLECGRWWVDVFTLTGMDEALDEGESDE